MPLEDPVPYGPEGYAGYGQAQDGNDAADQAKKAIPLIIGLLVLAILGYFAYDYAVLSVKTASVSVKNTENEALNTATVRVYALNQKTALATFTGTKTLELRRGEYEYEVAAAGYKPGRGAFSVDDKGSAVVIELEGARPRVPQDSSSEE